MCIFKAITLVFNERRSTLLTWSVWQVSPLITSIFFILGVFTLYQVLFDWMKSVIEVKKWPIDTEKMRSWFGVVYILIFVYSTQLTMVGKSSSWEFMNFQLIALVFCAYFLRIVIPLRWFVPIVLIYMGFNGSLGYWESWCHATTIISFYFSLNYVRSNSNRRRLVHPFLQYLLVGIAYGGLLWFWVKIKFSLGTATFFEGWVYLILFEILLYSYVRMLLRENELMGHLMKFANHDALTKTENYAAYANEMKYLFDNSHRNKLNLSMMMFDIDHFKVVNDTYGHLAGDKVLQHVVEVVQTVIDENDPNVKLYRTGGEEFNVVFPNYDLDATEPIVRQIFMALNHSEVDIGIKKISISISMVVSEVSTEDKVPNDFYSRVDANLYHSKKNGRMQITAI